MFDELLRIKKFREDAAQRAVASAEKALEARREAVRDAETALENHRTFRTAEEVRLFNEIKGEPVRVSRLDQMKQAVALLRDDEVRLAEKLEEERRTVPPAEQAVDEAKEVYRAAMKATQKFEEFVSIQHREEEKERIAHEDAEAEEINEATFTSHMAEAI